MKQELIVRMLEMLLNLLSPAMLRSFVDAGLDKIEELVVETENPYDDAALALCATIRATFDIPDDD